MRPWRGQRSEINDLTSQNETIDVRCLVTAQGVVRLCSGWWLGLSGVFTCPGGVPRPTHRPDETAEGVLPVHQRRRTVRRPHRHGRDGQGRHGVSSTPNIHNTHLGSSSTASFPHPSIIRYMSSSRACYLSSPCIHSAPVPIGSRCRSLYQVPGRERIIFKFSSWKTSTGGWKLHTIPSIFLIYVMFR